jgi:rhamnose transport system permease protein
LLGVLGGVLLLGTLRNALQLDNVSADALTMVTGGLLIISVLVPNLVQYVRDLVARRNRQRLAAGSA